jgi:DNA topoisomerase I
MFLQSGEINIHPKSIRKILNDPEKTAEAINLRYVTDTEPGIKRIKKNGKFIYRFMNKIVTDEQQLERMRKLVIPPAWRNVWICRHHNGHLQATGIDLKKRKQYRYHTLWCSLRNHTKFFRLHEFGKHLPMIRKQLAKDLSRNGLPSEKILAAVVSLMEQTSIRVGNSIYEKLYGSFGITTLKNKHVRIKGQHMTFMFRGKKGVSHKVSLKNKKLAAIVKQCLEIPGRELFQYMDEEGVANRIDSGMVNDYIRKITGREFSAKDFRTWTGTVCALQVLMKLEYTGEPDAIRKNIISALDFVAKQLGNTRAVCKKYYVHPLLLHLYENGLLQDYIVSPTECGKNNVPGLVDEEKILMHIIGKEYSFL